MKTNKPVDKKMAAKAIEILKSTNMLYFGIVTEWDNTSQRGVITRDDGRILEFASLQLTRAWG